ncbi:uncharacterized protein [Chelonus insularis]|uniref:uncharacterized protein n=1 Tax=Chelonus insularis TaxID=460826 RepID=UPI00158B6E37|nr:uncharacterized protein LOC118068146 [Chelonus insularis]
MSSLLIFQNAHLIMMELAIDKILISSDSHLNSDTIKKTIVKFQILDNNGIMLNSQCKDYTLYNGSNIEEKNFYEGKSVLFAISESDFKHKISNTAIEIHLFRELFDNTTMKPCYSIGSVRIPMNSLFNQIIQEVMEQKPLNQHCDYFDKKNVISRSLKETFTVNHTNMNDSASALVSIYIRLNYFGKSIVTEIERLSDGKYRVSEETCKGQSYQCHEVSCGESETGFWGVENDQLSVNSGNLIRIHDTNIRSDDKGITQVVDTQEEGIKDYSIENEGNGKKELLSDNDMNQTRVQKGKNSINKKKKIKKGRVRKSKYKQM